MRFPATVTARSSSTAPRVRGCARCVRSCGAAAKRPRRLALAVREAVRLRSSVHARVPVLRCRRKRRRRGKGKLRGQLAEDEIEMVAGERRPSETGRSSRRWDVVFRTVKAERDGHLLATDGVFAGSNRGPPDRGIGGLLVPATTAPLRAPAGVPPVPPLAVLIEEMFQILQMSPVRLRYAGRVGVAVEDQDVEPSPPRQWRQARGCQHIRTERRPRVASRRLVGVSARAHQRLADLEPPHGTETGGIEPTTAS